MTESRPRFELRPRWRVVLPVFAVVWILDWFVDPLVGRWASSVVFALAPLIMTWTARRWLDGERVGGGWPKVVTWVAAALTAVAHAALLVVSVFAPARIDHLDGPLFDLFYAGRLAAVVWVLFYVRAGRTPAPENEPTQQPERDMGGPGGADAAEADESGPARVADTDGGLAS